VLAQADLSRLHAVVPVRSIAGGKARLGETLDPEERESLISGLLRHELRVLRDWPRCRQVHVVSRDPLLGPEAEADGAFFVHEAADGLNAGIRSGVAAALRAGATAVLVLPGDLPYLAVDALERLWNAADATLAAGSGRPIALLVAADARGGTNGLLLSPPDLIEPCFGPDSLERHLRAAALAEASVQVLVEPELSFDLDTPEDLERLDPARLADLLSLGAVVTS
jgi:2-phospho-L-lactate/phosphoenolpyruvate guanylyltransferase